MLYFCVKLTKFSVGWGSAPDPETPLGSLQCSPDSYLDLKEGRGRQGREWDGTCFGEQAGKGRGEGEGGKGKGSRPQGEILAKAMDTQKVLTKTHNKKGFVQNRLRAVLKPYLDGFVQYPPKRFRTKPLYGSEKCCRCNTFFVPCRKLFV